MRFLELILLRGLLWVGLPLALLTLAVGPARVWRGIQRGWNWLFRRRLEPEQILAQVVRQHQEHLRALQGVIAQAEAAEAALVRNQKKSQDNIDDLEREARELAARKDELGARGALYKLNLERAALQTFGEQLERQRSLLADSRRRHYLLELQLRQYEVGRSVLLSQLAEAKTAEQQYAIASQFDPFSAVASWQQAEGMVQEKALNARAAERVQADLQAAAQPIQVDPSMLEAQLAQIKAMVSKTDHADAARQEKRPQTLEDQ